MRRREVITLIGGTAAMWSLAARAQQAALPIVAVLNEQETSDAFDVRLAVFQRGLSEGGYDNGRNVTIETYFALGSADRLFAYADALRRNIAVIFTTGGRNAANVAKKATSTIPIVFISSGDLIRDGLVAALNRPGGNATGVNLLAADLNAKRIELIDQILPRGASITFLNYSPEHDAAEQAAVAARAAQGLGRPLTVAGIAGEADFEPAFAAMAARHDGGFVIGANAFYSAHVARLVGLAAQYSLPAIYQWREFVTQGGLMGYGTNLEASYALCGHYVARILAGENPADMPVQQATKFDLVINLKTAKTLGLTLPLPVLGFADEVIE
jgi:ABC-type uncharacterized transport system substrate-binding protein